MHFSKLRYFYHFFAIFGIFRLLVYSNVFYNDLPFGLILGYLLLVILWNIALFKSSNFFIFCIFKNTTFSIEILPFFGSQWKFSTFSSLLFLLKIHGITWWISMIQEVVSSAINKDHLHRSIRTVSYQDSDLSIYRNISTKWVFLEH